MTKIRKLFLILLFAFVLDDACKYIKHLFFHNKVEQHIRIGLLHSNIGPFTVYNKGIIFIIMVSVIYFSVNFFKPEEEYRY